MNTAFLLMALYEGRPVIPVDLVCRDFFSHLTPAKFVRKISAGEIDLPMMRMEDSQKSAKGIHLNHLAAYLDKRMDAAEKEARQLAGTTFSITRPKALLPTG